MLRTRLLSAVAVLPVLWLIAFAVLDGRSGVLGLRAASALERSDYLVASAQLERAHSLAPGNAELWLQTAELERQRFSLRGEQDARARMFQAYGRAAILSPFWAKPLDDRSQAEALLGDYPAALRSADEAVRRNPNSGGYRELRAQYLEQMGRTQDAIAAYRETLERKSSASAEAALRRLGATP